jgi:hypothetical protein
MAEYDIRDARFYVVSGSVASEELKPLAFDQALDEARTLAENGREVHVLYTDDASQMQLTRFVSLGIPTSLVSQG